MLNFKPILIFCLVLAVGSCGWFHHSGKTIHHISAPIGYANEVQKISLLDPYTRNIVHCYDSSFGGSENCARKYERKNFVRFRDIPYKTANYDFLTRETYPTRRWREHERTPRW